MDLRIAYVGYNRKKQSQTSLSLRLVITIYHLRKFGNIVLAARVREIYRGWQRWTWMTGASQHLYSRSCTARQYDGTFPGSTRQQLRRCLHGTLAASAIRRMIDAESAPKCQYQSRQPSGRTCNATGIIVGSLTKPAFQQPCQLKAEAVWAAAGHPEHSTDVNTIPKLPNLIYIHRLTYSQQVLIIRAAFA